MDHKAKFGNNPDEFDEINDQAVNSDNAISPKKSDGDKLNESN